MADLDNLQNLLENNYDAIFNVGALHHGFRLSRTLWALNKALKPNGLMFNFDYVGPAQHMYSDEHLELLNNINQNIPERFQSIQHFRPTKEDFAFGETVKILAGAVFTGACGGLIGLWAGEFAAGDENDN